MGRVPFSQNPQAPQQIKLDRCFYGELQYLDGGRESTAAAAAKLLCLDPTDPKERACTGRNQSLDVFVWPHCPLVK